MDSQAVEVPRKLSYAPSAAGAVSEKVPCLKNGRILL
jgi:hypothetical protein